MTPLASVSEALVHPPEAKLPSDPRGPFIPEPFPALAPDIDDLPAPTLSETFRHSGWSRDRQRVYDALQATRQSPSRLDSFAHCGDRAYVYRSLDDPTLYRVAGSACHDRFCCPCTRERGQAIAANVTERLGGRRARFVTLTLKTDGLDLAAGLLKLQNAFRSLLRSNLWLDRVSGGAAFLEAKRNPDSARWHPHIHAIVQGRYLPHDLLKAAWLRITGDSSVVRIQSVKDEASVTRYVTTYAAKSLRTADFPEDPHLREAVQALHGTRLVRTFGDWRGLPLTDTPVSGTWEIVAPLADLLGLAVTGDRDACAILSALSTPAARLFRHEHPARPPPPCPGSVPLVRLQPTFDFLPCPLF